jgi:hypothetical protein
MMGGGSAEPGRLVGGKWGLPSPCSVCLQSGGDLCWQEEEGGGQPAWPPEMGGHWSRPMSRLSGGRKGCYHDKGGPFVYSWSLFVTLGADLGVLEIPRLLILEGP